MTDHLSRFDRENWSCGRKRRYRTWTEAEKIRKRMSRHKAGGVNDRLEVYRCRHCQGFHLGSK